MKQTALVCGSHSPLLYCFEKPPADWQAIQDGLARCRAFVDDFAPELVVIFGADHFNGFFLDMMPAFCIGLDAQATADIGGFSGPLDVPSALATEAIGYLRQQGFDPAVSFKMTVDHAFSQTLTQATGGLAVYPTIPVFINCITEPFVPFARSRQLGATLGEFLARQNKRTLFIASGGMSHHPTRYYPAYTHGQDAVSQWQLNGNKVVAGGMCADSWLERLDVMHHEGAALIARGERTAKDMRINEESDREFLAALLEGDLESFDHWDQQALVARGGIGSMELHTWIAAAAAHQACGGAAPNLDVYSVAPEIGIGFGLIYG